MNILKLKSILFSLMAIVTVTVFLSSCEKDNLDTSNNDKVEITEDEVITVQRENLSTLGSQGNNLKDLVSYQESFVELWTIVNERVMNNGNLLNAYKLGKTSEELEEALLKDIGYGNNTYNDFLRVYSYSLTKYQKSLKANGLNLDDENTLKKSFNKDIASNLIISRSCRGECSADYWVDATACVALAAIPWPVGPGLSAACIAANAYELYQCYDTCNGG